MKKFITTICIVTSTLIINGCASMFGDNTRTISINSNPSGADIYIHDINHGISGTTPMTVTLPRYIYSVKSITLRKTGYKDAKIDVGPEFQLVGLWNILTFPFGFIIDGATGNIVKINPTALNSNINLLPLSTEIKTEVKK